MAESQTDQAGWNITPSNLISLLLYHGKILGDNSSILITEIQDCLMSVQAVLISVAPQNKRQVLTLPWKDQELTGLSSASFFPNAWFSRREIIPIRSALEVIFLAMASTTLPRPQRVKMWNHNGSSEFSKHSNPRIQRKRIYLKTLGKLSFH